MPTEADVRGPMAEEIRRYFQGARVEAHDRIPLFRLAWDTCLSAFASRQVLYERFFLATLSVWLALWSLVTTAQIHGSRPRLSGEIEEWRQLIAKPIDRPLDVFSPA